MLRHYREKHMGYRLSCTSCGHRTARASDLAEHMRRKHGAPSAAPRPAPASCTQTPARRRKMADADEWLPSYRIPKRKASPLQPVVRMTRLSPEDPIPPVSAVRTGTPRRKATATVSKPPSSESTPEATVIHPTTSPPPLTPSKAEKPPVDLESPPLCTRTIVKLNVEANTPVPSPESPEGVRSGFRHQMTPEEAPPSDQTDSEGTKATKTLLKLMDEFSSQIPTIGSPSTPVQDELLVPCTQDNIVSVQPIGTTKTEPCPDLSAATEEPARTEPAPAPIEPSTPSFSTPEFRPPTPQAAPEAPPPPSQAASEEPPPAPTSPPPQQQGQTDPRRIQFTGEFVVTDNSFSMTINGGDCALM